MDITSKGLVGQTKEVKVHMETFEHRVRLTIWSLGLKRFVKHVLREAEYWTVKNRNRIKKDH